MTRQRVYFFLALVLFAMLHPQFLLAEGLSLFADKSLSELILVATDQRAGTFRIADSSGYAQDGALKDLIGVEGAKVTAVRDIAVEVTTEEQYDWYGTIRPRTFTNIIPLARALKGGKGVQ